jgi:hypothetical protein
MLDLGDTKYPLCLLDTLALSEMVKRPQPVLRNFFEWAMSADPCFVPAFSIFSVFELRRSRSLFDTFIEMFDPIPCVLLKGYEWFLNDEIAVYPDASEVDPCALAFTPLGDEGNLLRNLPVLLAQPNSMERERYWNQGEQEIVEGMVSLVPNYPPEGAKYSLAQLREFVELAGFTQLAMHDERFARRFVEAGEAVDIDAFPSLKAMLYTTFHKFYVDATRKPSRSDAFDVIIAAATPYVEAVITENHQAEVLRKVQRIDKFIEHVRIFTLKDFREGPPLVRT